MGQARALCFNSFRHGNYGRKTTLKIDKSQYFNPSDSSVKFTIGVNPTTEEEYECPAKGTILGPTNYANAFSRLGGLVLVGSDEHQTALKPKGDDSVTDDDSKGAKAPKGIRINRE